ncbi:unnamed protein product [Thelazia callipaeda]|uniref:Uncharacterized protein n=1 Tax=Thelazia callipaeda TaxID=103827 RepID=A0A0N5CZX7_THECL|nr:unnamed protein product [Thelazia callipaeda]
MHLHELLQYAGCYEGLVTAIKEECAFVWCLTLTFSEVLFINGPYKGMKVGDWIQFNVQ